MEVLVVGAGVVGCAVAWRLQQAGVRCTVLERSIPGAEASSAAAGSSPPRPRPRDPDLSGAVPAPAARSNPRSFASCRETSDVDVAFRPCGCSPCSWTSSGIEHGASASDGSARGDSDAVWLDAAATRALEPELSPDIVGAAHFPGDAVVDNRLLVSALTIAAVRAGARFVTTQVHGLLERGGRVTGAATDQGELGGDAVVVAAGAWTGLVPGALVSPARSGRPAVRW
jgi:glycine oxidase